MTTDTNEIIGQCCRDKEPITTLDHARLMRAYAGKIVADLETIESMIPSIVRDNIPESFTVVAANLNIRIHENSALLINSYLHVEREITNRLNS